MESTTDARRVTSDTANPALVALQQRVQERWDELTRSERAVAGVLVRSAPERLLYASAADLGKDSNTSNATVVRTIQNLGYQGLSELRQSIAAPFSTAVAPNERVRGRLSHLGSNVAQIASNVFTEATELLALTRDSLDENRLPQAIDVLASAQRVHAYGIGASSIAAGYLVQRLSRIGVRTSWMQQDGFLLADALLEVSPSDAIVAFVPGRMTKAIDAILGHAQMLGVPVVLITEELEDELSDLVSVSLFAPRTPTGLTGESFAAKVVCDVLVQGIAAVQPERAVQASLDLTTVRARLGFSKDRELSTSIE